MPEREEQVFELGPTIDGTAATRYGPDEARPQGAEGNLLDLEPDEAGRQLVREWNQSHRHVRGFMEQWRVNVARAKGYTGVQLIRKQDEMQAYIPAGAQPDQTGLNKAARLRRQLRAALFADPALPDAVPATDSDEDRDAAETSTRILVDQCSEGNLRYNTIAGDCFNLGSDFGSGFVHFWVDAQGGGWQPRQVTGDLLAQRADAPWPYGRTGRDQFATTWYVRNDGSLTAERSDPNLAQEWLPKLRYDLLTGRNVRLLPYTATDIWEAEGALVGALVPWGVVRGMFPDLEAQLRPGDVEGRILSFRPQQVKDLMPTGRAEVTDRDDEKLVFVLVRYNVQSPLYPRGARLVVVGDGVLADRREWWDELHGEPMDIAITQLKQFAADGNPYGEGFMQHVGPGNEARAQILGTMFEHLDKFQNRKIFAPLTSPAYPWLHQAPAGFPIPIVPGQQPYYEELPDFPKVVDKMFGFINADMEDEANLTGALRGLSQPGVRSGIDRQTVIEQALVMLSELRQHTEQGLVRGWRIMLQLIRAFFTEAQQLRWEGDDGSYKVKHWTQADLGSTRDVRLLPGSFSGLAPSAKAALAQTYHQMQAISLFRLQELLAQHSGGQLGLQQDPHRMRVRRQVAAWKEGPPQGWSFQGAPGAPDPATGQPTAPDPLSDPVLGRIFAPVAVDEELPVAQLRTYELGRALAGNRVFAHPPEWRAGLEAAYERARRAAGMVTAAEQQAAAQAQQQAAAAQAAQQGQAQAAAKAEQDQVRQAGEATKLEAERVKATAAVESERIRAEASVRTAELAATVAREGAGVSLDQLDRAMGGLAKIAATLKPEIPPAPPVTINVDLPPPGPRTTKVRRNPDGQIQELETE